MIDKRAFTTLGGANHGWLNAKHHFSFASYYDPARMGWGSIRVWNDDEIAAQSGFPPHPHDNMEIITYVRDGAITHEDSLGNKGRTEAGDVQVMSAGTGIRHAEYNVESELTRLFQIWVEPSVRGAAPAWGAKPFPKGDRAGRFVTLASGFEGDEDALPIRTPARLLGATFLKDQVETYTPVTAPEGQTRHLYLVVAKGRIAVNGVELDERDGAAIRDEAELKITALVDAEVVLLDAA
ncbi:pirin family protein [Asticcacaulis sp. EMRT-3]|uniref:pirin family protein n=1 Tax=Asticcacaulis sp. EMRT-3 TaxID=3040349 RepID=UPI0024AF7440|nr:pirin family protein [Asticcacaulis sp. EMRT-3]MDI7774442.1 pirin family protein [Asticcacaulis sp. EMRT-3]